MSQETIKRVATSIKIDPDLWKDTKIAAINYDTTVSELVESAIKEYIKRKKK
jgi:predicted transcriptional regulator